MKQKYTFETDDIRTKIKSLMPAVNASNRLASARGITFFKYGKNLGLSSFNEALTAIVGIEDQKPPRNNFVVDATTLSRALNVARGKETNITITTDDAGFMDMVISSGAYSATLPCLVGEVTPEEDATDEAMAIVIKEEDADAYWSYVQGAVSKGDVTRPAMAYVSLENKSGLVCLAGLDGHAFNTVVLDIPFSIDRQILLSPLAMKMIGNEKGDIVIFPMAGKLKTRMCRGSLEILQVDLDSPYPAWQGLVSSIMERTTTCSFRINANDLRMVTKAMSLFTETATPRINVSLSQGFMSVTSENPSAHSAGKDKIKITSYTGDDFSVSFSPSVLLLAISAWPYEEINVVIKPMQQGGYLAVMTDGDRSAESYVTTLS